MGGRLIGLNGFKGSGKDAVGDILVDAYGLTRVKFADLLYDSVAALFNIPRPEWEALKNDPDCRIVVQSGPYTHAALDWRTFMQRYGTEAHRGVFDPDFWIEQCMRRLHVGVDYVFTDARFDNELAAIRGLDGKNVRVERPGVGQDGDTHVSEALPDPALIDAELFNDGSLDDLCGKVDGLMSVLNI
jgi:hypothetical protein